MTWEMVMGLEVHLQLTTHSKIFSSSKTTFGAAPNEQTNPLDVALPGTLPVLNEAAVRQAVVFGLGVGVGFIVGIVIVYQILYSDVSEHLPEYATLKAMG